MFQSRCRDSFQIKLMVPCLLSRATEFQSRCRDSFQIKLAVPVAPPLKVVVSIPLPGFVSNQESSRSACIDSLIVSIPLPGFVSNQVGLLCTRQAVKKSFNPVAGIRFKSSPPPETLTEQRFHNGFWQTSKMT